MGRWIRRGLGIALVLAGLGVAFMRYQGIPFGAMRRTPPAGIETTALAIGAAAPAVTLTGADAATWRSEDVFGRRPAVLVFYRGHW